MRLVIRLAEIYIQNQNLHAQAMNEVPAGTGHTAGILKAKYSGDLLRGFIHLKNDRSRRYYGGNGVLINHLCNGIA